MMAQGLEVLQRNTNTLIGLISNLLDTSRIVAGTLTMEFKEVDLKQVVRASVETLRVQAAEKGIAVATLVEIPEAASCTICDLAMPEMNGYEVLENVRRLEPELGYLPVIAFTAAARDEDRAATRLAGFQAHLAKPIEPDELVRTVLELFNCKKEG
jgi:CheY-like chemotaxis protein